MAATDHPISNLLLISLDREDRELIGALEPVQLELRHLLQGANQPARFVYFPEGALVSVVASAPGRKDIEVGIIGTESMTGLALVQGDTLSPFESFVQVAGGARRIEADHFVRCLVASPSLKSLLLLHCRMFDLQVASTAIANSRYQVEERLARWLVMVSDRVGSDFEITHEFLGLMLGVRRSGVTVALQTLGGRGLVKATRGSIEIIDRLGLIRASKRSYGMAEREGERLVG